MDEAFTNRIKIAVIDLSNESIQLKSHSFNDDIFKKLLGGHGIVLHYLLKHMPKNVDPLGSDNYLCFISGILSATGVPFSGRFTVAAKSPLTGTWGEANSGGRFGPELRKTGHDVLLIKGKLSELGILSVIDNEIRIIHSPDLKTLNTKKTEKILKEKYGAKTQVASIGLAGENKVLISGIVTDGGRIAARSGLGAVMGSKNLKAVIVRGSNKISVAHPEELKELRRLVNKRITKGVNFLMEPGLKASTKLAPWLRRFKVKNLGSMSPNNLIIEGYRRWGTCFGTALAVEIGDAPVKNWNGSYKDFPSKKSAKLTGDNVTKYQIKKYGCHSCPMACGGIINYKNERFNIQDSHKPEYETLIMLGANLLNDDLGTVFQLNEFCNSQGIDTIAAGSLLAYAIEAIEKGTLTIDELGFTLEWGNPTNYERFLDMVVSREGVGDLFAQGLEYVSQKYGSDFAIHIKNQALPAHDPRYSNSQLLPYRLDPSPGRHTPFMEIMADLSKFSKMFPELDKENHIPDFYMYNQLVSSLGLCEFSTLTGNFPIPEFIKFVVGYEFTGLELVSIGERIFNLKHIFNLRDGINILDYKLPTRVLNAAKTGPNKEISHKTEKTLIEHFYTRLQWDLSTTIPRAERLKELGLEEYLKLY
ncbi:MAG: aldehyde ferredoxin oxidoreductase family protein [Candidatus Hodarchaeales archaeon]